MFSYIFEILNEMLFVLRYHDELDVKCVIQRGTVVCGWKFNRYSFSLIPIQLFFSRQIVFVTIICCTINQLDRNQGEGIPAEFPPANNGGTVVTAQSGSVFIDFNQFNRQKMWFRDDVHLVSYGHLILHCAQGRKFSLLFISFTIDNCGDSSFQKLNFKM